MYSITVTDWISWEEADGKEEALGGLGGWVDGNSWPEFLNEFHDNAKPYLEALKNEIRAKNIKFGGFTHQGEDGVPIFSDGKVAMFSMRAWGDLLAAVWNGDEKGPHNYCHFAWTDYEDRPAPSEGG